MIFPSLRRSILWMVLSCPALLAQNPAYFPWWNSPLRADLNLSEQQSDRIRKIVRSYRNRLLDSRNEMRKAEGDLQDLLNDAKIDDSAAQPLIDKVVTARASSTKVLLQMNVELRSVLTLDQWRKLVAKWNEKRTKPSDIQVSP